VLWSGRMSPRALARRVGAGLVLALAAGCARDAAPPRLASQQPDASLPSAEASADARPAIVFLGTSLTAGLGIDPAQAYPALIQQRLDAEGRPYRVVNAGVSGETSAGALRRIDWLLREDVALLVIETGANDGLRGQDPARLRDNIQALVDRARARRQASRLLLAGMHAPRNLGEEYGRKFSAVYSEVARRNDLPLIPFLLQDVAGYADLNQPDGIHPNAAGQRKIAETVWSALEPLL
jgi:acyl-CoA thioesterase I